MTVTLIMTYDYEADEVKRKMVIGGERDTNALDALRMTSNIPVTLGVLFTGREIDRTSMFGEETPK